MLVVPPVFKTLSSGVFALMLTFQVSAMAADASPNPPPQNLLGPSENGGVAAGGIGILSGGVGQDGWRLRKIECGASSSHCVSWG